MPLQIIGIQLLANYPEWVEKYYSQSLFQKIAEVERFLFGSIPFSIGDLLYVFFGVAIIYWLLRRIKTGFKHPQQWGLKLIAALSILYFCFHVLWGINYYRLPLHQSLSLQQEYEYEELLSLTKTLIHKSNALQEHLTEDQSQPVNFSFSFQEMKKLSVQGYDLVDDKHPYLNYNFSSVKKSLLSYPLTYMGFSGYLNPLTNEAQINYKLPRFKFPTLITHEMAHQIGYAKENEANFMAALATINHPNPYFSYAGYTFALQYCIADVARHNPKDAKRLVEKINSGVRKNYQESYDFWEKYENPLEPFFKLFYGNYLKVNQQPEGMQSYHYVVGLLVNYYQGEQAL
ncbi:MAG TPA: DUF3810 domain-containing protein [Flavobacteriaceae bacterium]|nr:DUF3810 domain-containing protein [Flavobacteriaceae bacterium]